MSTVSTATHPWQREADALVPEKLLLTAEEAALVLGVGRSAIFALVRTGELESLRLGARRRIPTAALRDYVARLRQTSATSAATGSAAGAAGAAGQADPGALPR